MGNPEAKSHRGLMSFILKVWMILKFWLGLSVFSEKPEEVTICFSIEQNRNIYELSIYGEPPQFGIWLEDPLTDEVRTVFVTYRTGHGDFEGKSAVPVALPAWIGAYQKETRRRDLPTPQIPVDMAVSGATQKTSAISREITVPRGSKWAYYVEVNVAGDYNPAFPSYQKDGTPDHDGNGQPSLIYSGEITAVAGAVSRPDLIGRTEQLYISTVINPDLEGIGNAKKLFKNIEVTCKPKK
jgi:hypothetical protein